MPGKVTVVPLEDTLVTPPDWLLQTSLCSIKCTEGFSRTVNEIKEKHRDFFLLLINWNDNASLPILNFLFMNAQLFYLVTL